MSFKFELDGERLTIRHNGRKVARYAPDYLRFAGVKLETNEFERLGRIMKDISPAEYGRIWRRKR